MRKVREVLRLMLSSELSCRQASVSAGMSHNTASRYLRMVVAQNLTLADIGNLSDPELDSIVHPHKKRESVTGIEEPNWTYIYQEMRRKGLTLQLLWHEYKLSHPEGMSYASFTRRYRTYRKLQGLVMRQDHKAGEKVFVDYSGMTVPLVDLATGEFRKTEIFIGVLGASSYCYAEATLSQGLDDWISSHIRMFEFFGGTPKVIVPDNLRSAVSKACAFNPVINPSYQEFAEHYQVAIVPARKYRPKDKALVENGVRLVQRWILAQLRNHVFTSLDELNAAIRPLIEHLNNKKFKKLDSSRRQEFENVDSPAMQALPAYPLERTTWVTGLRVGMDYHALVNQHSYSVPYRLVKEKVEARISSNIIEFFHHGDRVATHELNFKAHGHTTLISHMPKSHQQYAERSPELLYDWATRVGLSTLDVVKHQFERRTHPEAAYRACLGLQKLGKAYGENRLEQACKRGLYIKSPNYKSIESILKHVLDQNVIEGSEHKTAPIIEHENVRGEAYYFGEAS